MKTRMMIAVAWLCLVVVGAATQAARAQSLVIDEFSAGTYQHTLLPGAPGPEQNFQACGTCVGNFRETFFLINAENPFARKSTLEINTASTPGVMLLEGGLQSFWGLNLIYGSNPQGNMLLDVDLNPYSKLFIDVDSVDVGVSLTIVLFSHNGNTATLSTSLPLSSTTGYTREIPLADFYQDPAHPIDPRHIGQIAFVFQSGSAVSGDDFAISALRLGN